MGILSSGHLRYFGVSVSHTKGWVDIAILDQAHPSRTVQVLGGGICARQQDLEVPVS